MAYKIAYLEDQGADSVVNGLKEFGIDALHIIPEKDFGKTIEKINEIKADLIIMDFRLVEGGDSLFNAPPFAQYYRSLVTETPKVTMPIVLLSNDDKIKQFYFHDFTSHDLFDYTIEKEKFFPAIGKYARIIKSLIDAYKDIAVKQLSGTSELIELLSIPDIIKENIDPRIGESLVNTKNSTDTFMASTFILNQIVRPIGILIGVDVVASRLGVSKGSPDWSVLMEQLEPFKYNGIFSNSFDRWWAEGLDYWWKNILGKRIRLRRLNCSERLGSLVESFAGISLSETSGDAHSMAHKYWTICKKTSVAVDPSEAYEIQEDLNNSPWIDSTYYSYEAIRDNGLNSELTETERTRYRDTAQRK